MEDETKVEETTDSPSEETNTEEEVVEPKSVPYDRFQEVVKQKNQYKELLDLKENKPEAPVKTNTDMSSLDEESALKLIDERAKIVARSAINEVQRKTDLDSTIAQNPDFFKYHDIIKSKIQDNPHLAWSDAYKLAKFDVSTSEAKEQGKQEAYKKQEEKKKAVVETTTKAKVMGGNDEINPLAKGPDGKYLYSTKELEDILPKH